MNDANAPCGGEPLPLDEQLRRAIRDANLSYRVLAEISGLDRANMRRFLTRGTDIRLSSASKIAAALGLHLTMTGIATAARPRANRADGPAGTGAVGRPVQLRGRDRSVLVFGRTKPPLRRGAYAAVSALADAWPRRISKADLERAAGKGARSHLRALREADPDWDAVLGGRSRAYQGYGLSWPESGPGGGSPTLSHSSPTDLPLSPTSSHSSPTSSHSISGESREDYATSDVKLARAGPNGTHGAGHE
jgi:hypothetical protein